MTWIMGPLHEDVCTLMTVKSHRGLDRPLGLQEVEAVTRQSAHIGTGDTAGTHFCYRLSQPQGHSVGIYLVELLLE